MSSTPDLEEEVQELRERVRALESVVAVESPDTTRDQYDAYVLKKLREADETVFTKQLHIWYRQSGIRSKSKRRDRIKALAQDDTIEPVGTGGWRWAGARQLELGEP